MQCLIPHGQLWSDFCEQNTRRAGQLLAKRKTGSSIFRRLSTFERKKITFMMIVSDCLDAELFK